MENHNFYEVNPCKSTISMAIFNSYVSLPEGILGVSDVKPIQAPRKHLIIQVHGFLFGVRNRV